MKKSVLKHGGEPSVTHTFAIPSASFLPEGESDEDKKGFVNFLYDKEKKEICGRTVTGWMFIILYAIMYFLFLCAFTFLVLYGSLCLIKSLVDFSDKRFLRTFEENGIGLTATPSFASTPLITYRLGEEDEYNKYVDSLNKIFINKRKKRELSNLGPCGQPPYGYGEKPCVVIKVNRQINWKGRPLQKNSTLTKSAPQDVLKWMERDKDKLWLHCSGHHHYDKQHIKKLKYYPDPPGIDSKFFPLQRGQQSPLVAIQIAEFTLGVSLAIECKLWYDPGPSKIQIQLYIKPK